MKVYKVASWTRMALFALFGAVTFWMGHDMLTWEFWVLLLMMTGVGFLSDIESQGRFNEWLKQQQEEK